MSKRSRNSRPWAGEERRFGGIEGPTAEKGECISAEGVHKKRREMCGGGGGRADTNLFPYIILFSFSLGVPVFSPSPHSGPFIMQMTWFSTNQKHKLGLPPLLFPDEPDMPPPSSLLRYSRSVYLSSHMPACCGGPVCWESPPPRLRAGAQKFPTRLYTRPPSPYFPIN